MMDLSALEGSWLKTNDGAPQWLRSFDISATGGALRVHARGDGGGSPDDWGVAEAESLYALNAESARGAAFIARFDFDEIECVLQGNVNLGLLVVACFTRFRDGSGRADLFSREFFHRV